MDFDSLLKLMAHKKASDLFITVGTPPAMKVSGKIKPVTQNALNSAQCQQIVTGIMNDRQRADFEANREANFAISRSGVGRFRVSAFMQRNQIGMVIRRIEMTIPTYQELKLPEVIKDLSMTKRGLILFVGATGSGKSTSLASMIGYRNSHGNGHIITIEDPIEFVHQHDGCLITQREVGVDTDSFEIALKNTLRQAPDVILIGEIRTRETMDHAIAFAETGHLCLATLHANNTNQAMDRIINFFPEERKQQLLMDLAMNVKAFIAQQLIPTPDGKGRRAAIEIMINSPLISDLILNGETHKIKEVVKRSRQEGMQTFDQALYDLYHEEAITYEDAIHSADSANDLRLMIKLGDEEATEAMGSTLDGVSFTDTRGDKESQGMNFS